MKNIEKTEEKAVSNLADKRERFLRKGCPVFKTNCRGDNCHSYNEGQVTTVSFVDNVRFKVFEPCCSSPLVTGLIEHHKF